MLSFSTFVFDVGGTLLRLDYAAVAQIYVDAGAARGITLNRAKAGAVLEELENQVPLRQKQRQVSLENDNGKSFWGEFFTEGFRRLGVRGDVSREVTEIRERFQRGEFEALFDDVIPALTALYARGKQLGILSNFSPNLENLLRQLDIHHYFSFFVVSGIVGVEKPDPRIFDWAVGAAKRPCHEIVYVGDSIFHDIEGAQRAGVAAILVDRQDRYHEFSGARVCDLRELAI